MCNEDIKIFFPLSPTLHTKEVKEMTEFGIRLDPVCLAQAEPKMTLQLSQFAEDQTEKASVETSMAWKSQLAAKQLKRIFKK